MNKMKMLQEIEKKGNGNLAELIGNFERQHNGMSLKYTDLFIEGEQIIINVYDLHSRCMFDLILNERTKELEMK